MSFHIQNSLHCDAWEQNDSFWVITPPDNCHQTTVSWTQTIGELSRGGDCSRTVMVSLQFNVYWTTVQHLYIFSRRTTKCPTFRLQTLKLTKLMFWVSWCNCWVTVWLGLHPTLIPLCMISSLWEVSIPFTPFLSSINSCCLIKTNLTGICNSIPFVMSTQFGDKTSFFNPDAIPKWLPTKAKERVTCPWNPNCLGKLQTKWIRLPLKVQGEAWKSACLY